MKLKFPVLFINFKTYKEATGKKAVELAKTAEKVAKETKTEIVLVPQTVDLRLVSSSTSLPVFAQHIDPVEYGSNTGYILVQAVKEAGAVGTIINHAENKRDNSFVRSVIEKAKALGLVVMACAETTERAKQLAAFSPDLIAVEPPGLIGGNISVSTAKPEIITNSVKAVHAINKGIKLITGAGIKNSKDVKKSSELGAEGVFVASGVVKASNQEQAIRELVNGFKKIN